jgi:hypothetical protein
MAKIRLAASAAALVLATLGAGTAASAQDAYRPLTVAPRHAPRASYAPRPYYYVPAQPAYNPYGGPGAIVTAPTHFAGDVVGAPFHALNTVFPAQGNTPLVLIGGPIQLAGRLAQLPFRVAEAIFGGPDPFRY